MRFLLSSVSFIAGAYYLLSTGRCTRGQVAALLLGMIATAPILDGALLLYLENARWHDGRVATGVVVGKLSSIGAAGSRTIGGDRASRPSGHIPTVFTSTGFQFHDVLARLVLTGSRTAWMVEYQYPCDAGRQCQRRDAVSKSLWSDLQVGHTVDVLIPVGRSHLARLDPNPMLSTALAKLAIGGALGLLAAFSSGRLRRAAPKYVTVPGVVMSVEPIGAGGKVHWRVQFAYFATDGTAFEGVDEVYVAGLHPGDDCTVVYPPDQPDLGTFRSLAKPAPASGALPNDALSGSMNTAAG